VQVGLPLLKQQAHRHKGMTHMGKAFLNNTAGRMPCLGPALIDATSNFGSVTPGQGMHLPKSYGTAGLLVRLCMAPPVGPVAVLAFFGALLATCSLGSIKSQPENASRKDALDS